MPEKEKQVIVAIQLQSEEGTMLAQTTTPLKNLEGLEVEVLGAVLRQALIDTCKVAVGEREPGASTYIAIK